MPSPDPDPDAWENHVIRLHPGQLAYPGSAPATTLKILEIIEDRERRDRMIVSVSSYGCRLEIVVRNDLERWTSH